MPCLGLHGAEVTCLECGTPAPPSVSTIGTWQRLEQSIVILYRGDLTDHCPHALAVKRTAEACGVSRHFVEKTLRKLKAIP